MGPHGILEMSTRRRPILHALIWLVFAGTAVGLFLSGLQELSAEIRSYRWETTRGEVRRIESHRSFRHVYYAYEVGGRSYNASHDFMVVPLRTIPAVSELVTIYYDPDRPEDSLLRKGIRFDGGT